MRSRPPTMTRANFQSSRGSLVPVRSCTTVRGGSYSGRYGNLVVRREAQHVWWRCASRRRFTSSAVRGDLDYRSPCRRAPRTSFPRCTLPCHRTRCTCQPWRYLRWSVNEGPPCYRSRYLNTRRLNYLLTIRLSSARRAREGSLSVTAGIAKGARKAAVRCATGLAEVHRAGMNISGDRRRRSFAAERHGLGYRAAGAGKVPLFRTCPWAGSSSEPGARTSMTLSAHMAIVAGYPAAGEVWPGGVLSGTLLW